jgi:hypothetical protein
MNRAPRPAGASRGTTSHQIIPGVSLHHPASWTAACLPPPLAVGARRSQRAGDRYGAQETGTEGGEAGDLRGVLTEALARCLG